MEIKTFYKKYPNFDWNFYLNYYPDLVAYGIKTESQAIMHYLKFGLKENRMSNKISCSEDFYYKDLTTCIIENTKSKTCLLLKASRGSCYICYHDNVIINHDQIKTLFYIFMESHADFLSPITIDMESKQLLYYGGIKLNDKEIYIGNDFISLSDTVNLKHDFNFTKNTSILNYDCYLCKNLSNVREINDDSIIKVTPFVTVQITRKRGPLNKTKVSSFYFEHEIIREYIQHNLLYGKTSIYMGTSLYLDKSTRPYVLIHENSALEFNTNCGDRYIFNFCSNLIKLGYNVHFIPKNFAHNDYALALKRKGIYMASHFPFTIEEYLKNNCNVYKYIFVSRANLLSESLSVIRKYSPTSKLIFISHDLSHLRLSREPGVDKRVVSELEKEELGLIRNCETTLIVSKFEMDYLKHKGVHNITYFPICYPLEKEECYSFEHTKGIYFIGSQHPPNLEALEWFLKEIFPHIHGISFHIIGSCCKRIDPIFKKIYKDRVVLHNFVKDSELKSTLKKMRLNIVPLKSGAGIKGKILESLNFQIPVISSVIGVEGMGLEHNKNCIVFDHSTMPSQEIAKLIIKSYNNVALLKTIAKNGYELYSNNFSISKGLEFTKKLFNKLDSISTKPYKSEGLIAVLCVCYNNYAFMENLISFLDKFSSITFEIYCIDNDQKSFEKKGIHVVPGDNTLYEFSGFQICLNKLKNRTDIDGYVLLNDSLSTNHPTIVNTSQICLETFQHILQKGLHSAGHVDSFGEQFILNDCNIVSWYRANLIFLSRELMQHLEYKVWNIKVEDKYSISKNVDNKITEWLCKERYNNLTDENIKKKKACIMNEYILAYKIQCISQLTTLRSIKHKAYKKTMLELKRFDKLPNNKREWESF